MCDRDSNSCKEIKEEYRCRHVHGLHEALEKRVNKITTGLTRKKFLLTQGRY